MPPFPSHYHQKGDEHYQKGKGVTEFSVESLQKFTLNVGKLLREDTPKWGAWVNKRPKELGGENRSKALANMHAKVVKEKRNFDRQLAEVQPAIEWYRDLESHTQGHKGLRMTTKNLLEIARFEELTRLVHQEQASIQLLNVLSFNFNWLVRFCKEKNIDIPDKERLYQSQLRIRDLIY